jgi:hypothetical protein
MRRPGRAPRRVEGAMLLWMSPEGGVVEVKVGEQQGAARHAGSHVRLCIERESRMLTVKAFVAKDLAVAVRPCRHW